MNASRRPSDLRSRRAAGESARSPRSRRRLRARLRDRDRCRAARRDRGRPLAGRSLSTTIHAPIARPEAFPAAPRRAGTDRTAHDITIELTTASEPKNRSYARAAQNHIVHSTGTHVRSLEPECRGGSMNAPPTPTRTLARKVESTSTTVPVAFSVGMVAARAPGQEGPPRSESRSTRVLERRERHHALPFLRANLSAPTCSR